MLLSIGISKKIIEILEKFYKNCKCGVTTDDKLTEWFSPNLLTSFKSLFLMKLSNNFDMNDADLSLSINYADESTLLTLDCEKLQTATYELQQACIKWDMKINLEKCKSLILSVDNILIQEEYT